MERHTAPGPTLLRLSDPGIPALIEGRSDHGRIVGAYRADLKDGTPRALLLNSGVAFGVFDSHAAAVTGYHAYIKQALLFDTMIVLTRFTRQHYEIGDRFPPFYVDSTVTMDIVQRVGGRFWYARRDGYFYVFDASGESRIRAVMVAGEAVVRAVAELYAGNAVAGWT
jgi:hypothetical protein